MDRRVARYYVYTKVMNLYPGTEKSTMTSAKKKKYIFGSPRRELFYKYILRPIIGTFVSPTVLYSCESVCVNVDLLHTYLVEYKSVHNERRRKCGFLFNGVSLLFFRIFSRK